MAEADVSDCVAEEVDFVDEEAHGPFRWTRSRARSFLARVRGASFMPCMRVGDVMKSGGYIGLVESIGAAVVGGGGMLVEGG